MTTVVDGPPLEEIERLFKALADATRLRIVALLVDGEVCVCHLHETLRLPQPTVSRHLAYLRHRGLVETRREGLWVHYRLANLDDAVLRTLTSIVAHALGHVEVIRKDLERLRKRTGCCVPQADTDATHALECCGSQTAQH